MFLPNHAKALKTYQRDMTTVNLYHSEWLEGRFPATMEIKGKKWPVWVGGEPGDFTLQYNVYHGQAHSLIIALGNNP
jgi:hypothetical protein